MGSSRSREGIGHHRTWCQHVCVLVWVFSNCKTSYSNLPKQIDILSLSIQKVFQNIENSSIREHGKICTKFLNYGNIYGHIGF